MSRASLKRRLAQAEAKAAENVKAEAKGGLLGHLSQAARRSVVIRYFERYVLGVNPRVDESTEALLLAMRAEPGADERIREFKRRVIFGDRGAA